METDTAFVRADGVVELNAVAEVVLDFALIVDPSYTESVDAIGFNHTFDDFIFLELGMLVVDVLYREKHLANCLEVLFFARMLSFQGAHDIVNVH